MALQSAAAARAVASDTQAGGWPRWSESIPARAACQTSGGVPHAGALHPTNPVDLLPVGECHRAAGPGLRAVAGHIVDEAHALVGLMHGARDRDPVAHLRVAGVEQLCWE